MIKQIKGYTSTTQNLHWLARMVDNDCIYSLINNNLFIIDNFSILVLQYNKFFHLKFFCETKMTILWPYKANFPLSG